MIHRRPIQADLETIKVRSPLFFTHVQICFVFFCLMKKLSLKNDVHMLSNLKAVENKLISPGSMVKRQQFQEAKP